MSRIISHNDMFFQVKELPRKVPVHIVAFNCDDSGTVRFLKDFTDRSGAK